MTLTEQALTARELVSAAESRLAESGVEGPRFDAELLLADLLRVTRPELVAALGDAVDPSTAARYEDHVARRASREPLAYITGFKGFRGIELAVDPRALIPRPETELLVAVVKTGRPCGILDVATGSGAVALALAHEMPDATIVASDVSEGALEVARDNALRLGLADRVALRHSDLLDRIDGSFDAIAANLPYVRSGEIDDLQPEIGYEPRGALDGGDDGLDLVRELVRQVRDRDALKPGGLIALEIGDDQGPQTARILTEAGFTGAEIHQDLAGRDRVVSARRPA